MSYPEEREETLRSKIYKKYSYDIFPRINHIRGTTRLKDTLVRIAQLGIPKINRDRVEKISDKEWDNLIILDAARHDTYRETINPKSDYRITAESHSRGFIRENFSEGEWSETVVITANPFYNEEEFEKLTGEKPKEKFETIFQVWKTDWNEEKGTVMPEKLVEKARTAQKLFPNKRKILHFMQPHYPFIESEIDEPGFSGIINDEDLEQIWERTEKGELKHSKSKNAYLKNHEPALDSLDRLEDIIDGKTIITADHGNLLGEKGLYGHPGKSELEPLRKVPWDNLEDVGQ
jgi:hypothetical protein